MLIILICAPTAQICRRIVGVFECCDSTAPYVVIEVVDIQSVTAVIAVDGRIAQRLFCQLIHWGVR